jgi:hypothetical protein
MDDSNVNEEFNALTAGLEMPELPEEESGEDEDRDVAEMSDDEIQGRVDAVVENLRVDFFYVSTIKNTLEDDYEWSQEGAERIAQIYLERALLRRDLELDQEEQ